MIFLYRPALALCPETGAPELILRPDIPVDLFGPSGTVQSRALVDTGADKTVLPKRIGEFLGIPMVAGVGPSLTAFGGQSLPVFFGNIDLEIADGAERLRWPVRAQFFAVPSEEEESLILGQAGFLEYFAALFDADTGTLELTANDRLSAIS